MRGTAVSAAAIGACLMMVGQAQPHTLEAVLARAAEYHHTYATKISGVSLEEQMQVRNVSGDVTRSIVRIASDVVLVNVNGKVVALRDPFAIDTRPTRERTPRIVALLGAPATPSLSDWNAASAYPREAMQYFPLDIVVKVNESTLALQFIQSINQPGLSYRLDGRRTVNRVQTVGVRFEEPFAQGRTYLLGTRSNARATGRFWIDPVTGAIHQTELWVDARRDGPLVETANVSVKYALHPQLGVLLPSEMNNTYEEYERGVTYRYNWESRTTYPSATYTAIDLTKLR